MRSAVGFKARLTTYASVSMRRSARAGMKSSTWPSCGRTGSQGPGAGAGPGAGHPGRLPRQALGRLVPKEVGAGATAGAGHAGRFRRYSGNSR